MRSADIVASAPLESGCTTGVEGGADADGKGTRAAEDCFVGIIAGCVMT